MRLHRRRRLLFPLLIVCAAVVFAVAHHDHHRPNAPTATPAPTAAARAPRATQSIKTLVRAPAAAAPAAPKPSMSPAAKVAKPSGDLRQGLATLATLDQDQFGTYVQQSNVLVSAPRLDFAAPAGDGHQGTVRYVWRAWVRTRAPSSVVVLFVAGGGGQVSAKVGGESVGKALWVSNQFSSPVSEAGALTLPEGWYLVTVTDTVFSSMSGRARILLQLGDGSAAPAPPPAPDP